MVLLKQIFNNREIATIIWLLVFLIWFLSQPKLRSSLGGVFKSLANKWIALSIFAMLLYVSIIILGFYKIKIWNLSLLKDSIVWTFVVAFIMMMNADKALKNENYFKVQLIHNFRLAIVLEFIVNLYSFSLLKEIFILPIVIFFAMLQAYAEVKNVYSPVKKLLQIISIIIGLGYLIFASYKIVSEFDAFAKIDNLKLFFLPIVLTILFIPFIYFYALLMLYQSFYRRMKFPIQNDKLIKYSKKQIFKTCGLNLYKLKKISTKIIFFDIKSENDLHLEIKKSL